MRNILPLKQKIQVAVFIKEKAVFFSECKMNVLAIARTVEIGLGFRVTKSNIKHIQKNLIYYARQKK